MTAKPPPGSVREIEQSPLDFTRITTCARHGEVDVASGGGLFPYDASEERRPFHLVRTSKQFFPQERRKFLFDAGFSTVKIRKK